jgi:hypothetical protein
MGDAAAAIAERYRLMSSQSNERQRRRFAASEARTFGYGGIAAAARACGLAENTVRKGLLELDEPESLGPGRVRREGAGRPAPLGDRRRPEHPSAQLQFLAVGGGGDEREREQAQALTGSDPLRRGPRQREEIQPRGARQYRSSGE